MFYVWLMSAPKPMTYKGIRLIRARIYKGRAEGTFLGMNAAIRSHTSGQTPHLSRPQHKRTDGNIIYHYVHTATYNNRTHG